MSSGDYVRVVHGEGSVEVIARLERRRAEALALKIRGLARRFGLKMQSIRVVPGDTSPDDVSRPGQPSVDSP